MKISVLFLMFVIISGISLTGINQAFAFSCSTVKVGDWSDFSIWDNCDGEVPDDTGDSAQIFDSGVVQLNNDFVVGEVFVTEGGSLSINAKLTEQTLFVGEEGSNLFINCNGELVLTEGGSNEGLITNHGILRTITGADFTNDGTYRSSGTDTFVGDFIGNDIIRIASICVDVGGEFLQLDTTSLLVAGAQSFSWMIPVVLSAVGIGIFFVSRKSE